VFYFNRVILAGKLRDGPEVRYTSGGKPVIFFTLSLPSEKMEEGVFPFEDVSIRVMFSGEGSELWAKDKAEGGNVLVEGGLIQRRWQTQQGRIKKEIGVIAHKVRDLR